MGLRRLPFTNENADKAAILSKIKNEIARKVGKNDRVLIFYSGHGYTEKLAGKDWGYIVPYDGTGDSTTYISMVELRMLSEQMGTAKHQLFIMDACYGGLLGTKGGGVDTSVPNYLNEITSRSARQILTAWRVRMSKSSTAALEDTAISPGISSKPWKKA